MFAAAVSVLVGLAGLGATAAGCAHGPPAPQGPERALAAEAGRIGGIHYEDDFLEARLIFQALPIAAAERPALRGKLLHYLLDPVLALKPADLKREVRDLETDDVYDVMFESFRTLSPSTPRALDPAPGRGRRGSGPGGRAGDCDLLATRRH
jgi:hypothetical protein